jgi:hypothetical protein
LALTHCQLDPDIFFTTSPVDREKAIAACKVCLQRESRLEDAMRAEKGAGNRSRHGIYGGVTAKGRLKLEKEREAAAKQEGES